jgi:Ni/Fe-hydrogenase subunit HybB-like protein
VHLRAFLMSALRSVTSGHPGYHLWMGSLTALMLVGGYAYFIQANEGLVVTGMNDHVSWGLYISNMAFLVGVAAAAVILVLPAYVLHDIDFSRAVLIAEGVAVAALVMCLGFVMANSPGYPWKWWRLTPVIGILNWPDSMLAWDVIMLFIYISVIWAVSIHLVTAFLFAGLPARPFWNSPLLGPRFLASAFTAGPAFMILLLGFIRTHSKYEIPAVAIEKLATATTVAAQVNLVMLLSEVVFEFYMPTHHSISARYLFFGLGEHQALVPWIRAGILLNVAATLILMVHPLRHSSRWLMPACAALFVGIWVEKGVGLVLPGFIPSPLGEIVEYTPTWVELCVTVGIWAMGLFVLTILVRVALPIELGDARSPHLKEPPAARVIRPRATRGQRPEVRPARLR